MTSHDNYSEEDLNCYQSNVLFSPKHALPPLDLSFKSLLSSEDMKEELETHQQRNLKKTLSTQKYTCNAIRLNNNSLQDLTGFTDVISEAVADINDISWIDLSFNDLHDIADELLKFNNLKVLYLHGNGIEKLKSVKKLTKFPFLYSLTMHGNPIETEYGYRHQVLSLLPWLKTFDFSGVTKQDLSTAQVWIEMHATALKKRKRRSSIP